MIGDHYNDKWKDKPWAQPQSMTISTPEQQIVWNFYHIREEFDVLKKEVLEMKELLKRAVKYDERNDQPHCEMEDKVKLLKQVAEMVGVDLKDIFNRCVDDCDKIKSVSELVKKITYNKIKVNDKDGYKILRGYKIKDETQSAFISDNGLDN
jgi:hypothetical protein